MNRGGMNLEADRYRSMERELGCRLSLLPSTDMICTIRSHQFAIWGRKFVRIMSLCSFVAARAHVARDLRLRRQRHTPSCKSAMMGWKWSGIMLKDKKESSIKKRMCTAYIE